MLRRQGYPLAIVTVPGRTVLSAYMQFVHYTVFGLGFLRNMNFVTQPSVELYKAITARLYGEGGQPEAWAKFNDPEKRVAWRGRVFLHTAFYNGPRAAAANPAAAYAEMLKESAESGAIDTAELTFFGDNRYSDSIVALRGSTGEVVWHFQTVHHDVWDYDVPAQPPVCASSATTELE